MNSTETVDVSYDLQSSLLIDDQMGQPIAPVAQRLIIGKYHLEKWVYLSIQEVLQTHTLDELELMSSMAKAFLP